MKKICSVLLAVAMAVSCFLLPAAAANFTPSVVSKDIRFVEIVDPQTGEHYVAELRDANGETVLERVPIEFIYLTPYAKATVGLPGMSTKVRDDVRQKLQTAYQQISAVSDLGKLNKDLDSRAKQVNEKFTSANFVCYELFDLTTSDYYAEKLANNDSYYLRCYFDTKLAKTDPLPTVMYYSLVDQKWVLADEQDIIRRADGSISVDMFEAGPVMFLRLKQGTVKTGDEFPMTLWIVAGAFALAAAVVLIVFLAKRKEEDEPAEATEVNK